MATDQFLDIAGDIVSGLDKRGCALRGERIGCSLIGTGIALDRACVGHGAVYKNIKPDQETPCARTGCTLFVC
jgi:hypothetical protein